MSGGQIAALIFAILLLLPGGCFLVFGIGFATDRQFYDASFVMLPIAAALLGLAGFLFWIAFRRRRGPGQPPDGTPSRGCRPERRAGWGRFRGSWNPAHSAKSFGSGAAKTRMEWRGRRDSGIGRFRIKLA